jgi:hypothetical protein
MRRAPVIDSTTVQAGSDLVDPSRERSQRVDVGRDGELVEVLSLAGEQAAVNLLSTEV